MLLRETVGDNWPNPKYKPVKKRNRRRRRAEMRALLKRGTCDRGVRDDNENLNEPKLLRL